MPYDTFIILFCVYNTYYRRHIVIPVAISATKSFETVAHPVAHPAHLVAHPAVFFSDQFLLWMYSGVHTFIEEYAPLEWCINLCSGVHVCIEEYTPLQWCTNLYSGVHAFIID